MTHPAAPEPTANADADQPESTGQTASTTQGQPAQENPLGHTKTSQTWIAIVVFAVILVLLLIFILQNTQKVAISYFSATFTMPLAVAMLLAAVAGVLLTAIAATLRILQLRRRVRRGQRR